jgi:hypothetical protein
MLEGAGLPEMNVTTPPKHAAPPPARSARRERLERALRENIKRRKRAPRTQEKRS